MTPFRVAALVWLLGWAVALVPSWAADADAETTLQRMREQARETLRDPAVSEHFSLYDGCRPMTLFVRPLSAASLALGLTEETLHVVAEGHLVAAGLHDATADNALGITVRISGPVFQAQVAYLKVLLDANWDLGGYAITWEGGTNGLHGGDPNHILAVLHRHLGGFIEAFRRINAEACAAE